MIFPLVESCLPEEVLRTWQRSCHPEQRQDSANRLKGLISFLQSEVECEERIGLAMAGFGLGEDRSKNRPKSTPRDSMREPVATASDLLATSSTTKLDSCAFCSGHHKSHDCLSARKLELEERRRILQSKGACFSCLRPGHRQRNCKANVRCILCSRRHQAIMCSSLGKCQREATPTREEAKSAGSATLLKRPNSPANENALASFSSTPKVVLQTLVVILRSDISERPVRALLDTGSQRSYILQHTAEEMQYSPVRKELVEHSLFGGVKVARSEHNCYKIRLSNIEGSYFCNLEALDQPMICQALGSVPPGPWLDELDGQGISLTDFRRTGPIEVLLGADVIGKLVLRHVLLANGLSATETRLGWTLMGKIPPTESHDVSCATIATTSFVAHASISDLWDLDLLGIRDPLEQKSKDERAAAVKEHFMRTIKVDKTGRYEVSLPWAEHCVLLSSDKELARKRLQATTKRLRAQGLYDDYDAVLAGWKRLGIIEEVAEGSLSEREHYFPHHAVIKESSSTTRIRPVFDASAKSRDRVALNDCLEPGPNLMEQIPPLLIHFRRRRVGVTADIEKAFLQISVNPSDRDALRFLWWQDTADKGIKIYRHARVVFGVRSFLSSWRQS